MAFSMRIVGVPFGSITQPNESFQEAEDGAREIIRTYRTLYAAWLNTAPLRGSAHPVYPLAILSQRECKQITPGFLGDVTLTYRQPRAGGVGGGGEDPGENGSQPDPNATLPPTRYEETSSQIEIPIQQHPNWASTFEQHWDYSKGTWLPTAPSYLQGVFAYIVGSVVESETRYSWGQPASVSTEVGQVTGGGKWLTISGSRREEGLYWSRTINRLYSAKGWPAQIYT